MLPLAGPLLHVGMHAALPPGAMMHAGPYLQQDGW
jgi:hypothetical protein